MRGIYVIYERNWIQTHEKDLLTEFDHLTKAQFIELIIEIEKTVAEFKKRKNL